MSIANAMLRAGRFRHRATLQRMEETEDGGGGVSVDWVNERALWCWIRPTSGAQRMEAMRRESSVTHEIHTRYAQDITTEKRIVHRGKAYLIEAVFSPDERQEYLHIVAAEGVAT